MSDDFEQVKTKQQKRTRSVKPALPFWLLVFCYLLMGPAIGINCVFIAFSTPALAKFGLTGLVIAFAIGMVLGIPAARLLARKIHKGISE